MAREPKRQDKVLLHLVIVRETENAILAWDAEDPDGGEHNAQWCPKSQCTTTGLIKSIRGEDAVEYEVRRWIATEKGWV